MQLSSVFKGFWWNFAEFLMNLGILCKHFGTVTQCSVDPTLPVLLTAKPLETSQKPKKSAWLIESASKMILFDFINFTDTSLEEVSWKKKK